MNYMDENACRIAARCGIEVSGNFPRSIGITRDANLAVLWCIRVRNRRGIEMISRRAMLQTLMISALIGGSLPALAKSHRVDPVKLFDTDNDDTLDLDEVKDAASKLFDRLDPDHDGTLDVREVRGRLTARELAAADPDHDGTLTRDEYLAVVEQRFKAADPDGDGTLDARELRSRAGHALLRLLR